MKFKLLKQNDSVYKSYGITIQLEQWKDWEEFCIFTRTKGTETDIETMWDIDECRECGIISMEHLQNYFKWITK